MQLRARDDASFRDRIDLLSAARRATAVSRRLLRVFLAQTRLRETLSAEHQFAIGDHIFYLRGS